MHRAGCLVKSRSLADDVVAVTQAWRPARKQGAKTLLALDQWTLAQILANSDATGGQSDMHYYAALSR